MTDPGNTTVTRYDTGGTHIEDNTSLEPFYQRVLRIVFHRSHPSGLGKWKRGKGGAKHGIASGERQKDDGKVG